jgi:hypothetical protein
VLGLSAEAGRRVLAVITALNLVVLVGMPAIGALALEQYVWFTPAVAAGYIAVGLWLRRAGAERFVPQAQPPLLRAHA